MFVDHHTSYYSYSRALALEGMSTGVAEKYLRGASLAESSPQEAIPLLESVQKDIVALSLYSSNETIEDVSTKSLRFLALEHFLAMALVNLPAGPGKMQERKANINRSLALWSAFLGKLEQMELLSNEEVREYNDLLEEVDIDKPMLAPSRDEKIARFKAKQQAKNEMGRLQAMRERRNRCGVAAEEEMDGTQPEGGREDLGTMRSWDQNLR